MSEKLTETLEHLTLGQEAFLFGDQGELVDPELARDVFQTKLGLALLWLSNCWPKPYPDELVDAEYDARVAAEEMLAKWTAQGMFNPEDPNDQCWLEMTEPQNPIFHALRIEWRLKDGIEQTSIADREVLTTALAHAYNALSATPNIDAKLSYIVELIDENDRQIHETESNPPWEEPIPPIFPMPLDTYTLESFPLHEVNRDLH